MTPNHVHVVGAGLAGLAAALRLSARGVRVTVHEAGPQAGGRCRSYFDRELNCRVDNGNHLLLSGNRAAWSFLHEVGSGATMGGPGRPLFPFMDLRSGQRWALRPNPGRIPWWVLRPGRSVPGARLRDFLALRHLRRAGRDDVLDPFLRPGHLRDRLLEPLAVSALNTAVTEGSARLMSAVVEQSLGEGGAACVPSFPREGLSESFIDPAVATLRARGATVRTGSRVGVVDVTDGRVAALDGQTLGADEATVLAVPAPVAAALLPGLETPDRFEAILNVHFRLDHPLAPGDLREAGFIGLVGGLTEWVFVKSGVVSTTISAANRYLDRPNEALAQQVWQEVCAALGSGVARDEPIPLYRVVREKRATFAATPAQDRKRPPARTALANLVLAGDWTDTGLPATIEGAVRSGHAAAEALLRPTH